MRDYKDTLEWYRTHDHAREIGFNPDGMCLKVCRTARDIGPLHLTAKEAQDLTPISDRIFNVRKLRRGMVLFYDDPNDANRSGHIVTLIGRVKGFDPDSLHDLLVETNSVKTGELTVVRGDYFTEHWGDTFIFGATWLNGEKLDVPGSKRVEKFEHSGPRFDLKILDRMAKDGDREVGRIRDLIDTQVRRLPDSPKLPRVREFKQCYRSDRELRMMILNDAVRELPNGVVKQVRDEIRHLISTLPGG